MDMVKVYIYGERPLIPVERRKKLISNIRRVINLAHERGIPVIYINTAFRKSDPILNVIGYRPHAMKGAKDAGIIKELKPSKGDYILEKRSYDGFWKTKLEILLKKLKVDEIYLMGQQTDCCIMITGVTAAHLGYKVFVIEDCCQTKKDEWQKFAINFINGCVGKIVSSNSLEF